MRLMISFIILFLISGCQHTEVVDQAAATSERIVFYPSHEPKKQNAPFSDLVKAGDLYFLSGQVGMDHTSRTLVEGGIAAETRQCLENIKAVLEHHDLTMSQVVKATVILDSIEHFAQFNEIYREYLPHKPARTTFAAEDLAVGALIEIEVVAMEE